MENVHNLEGIWFFGMSGSGKSYASNLIAKYVSHSFTLDGDVIRKHISQDLGYTPAERNLQLNRIFGLTEIVKINGLWPVISTVSMNQDILTKCINKRIFVVHVKRPFEQLRKVRDLYDGRKNVVGIDIEQPDLNCYQILNVGDSSFDKHIINIINP
jgi:adenylylsulfate kinase